MLTSYPHVCWIGGSPCSGKSSIAANLAATHGMRVYDCDEAYERHRPLVTPRQQPVFHRLAHATCDDLWMRPIDRQVEEEIALYREQFPLILADVASMPTSQPVIAEGAALLPELVDGLSVRRNRAIWIVPTEAFQRAHYAKRAWRHDVLATCADQDQAWHNWMERDAGFARRVAREAKQRGFRLLVVDGTRSLAENCRTVEAWFGLA
jgi:2-phosphoglycerate kinase